MDNNQYNIKIIDDNNRIMVDMNCYDWATEGNYIKFYNWAQTTGYGMGYKEVSLIYGIKQGDMITPTKITKSPLKVVEDEL